MGFFTSFRRNNSHAGASQSEAADQYERSASLFPTKQGADSAAEGSERTDFKKIGAQSFSYPKRDMHEAPAQDPRSLVRAVTTPRSGVATPQYISISQFKQLVEIYAGSISNVYKGLCVATGQRVVVKVYHKAKMTPKQVHKLDREVDIQQRVRDCPYVCQLLATFEDANEVYLVLESCDGGDLFKTMMKAGGRLPEATVCIDVVLPLLRVLESLNTLRILHRDIKPENIFLTGDGQMRLGDFGLAIDAATEIPFCRSGAALAAILPTPKPSNGTLDYMAPEVLTNPCTRLEEKTATKDLLDVRNIVPYTGKVDVWAVGVLAYELVMGRPPFEVDNEAATVARILQSDDIDFGSRASSPWADFVRAALVKQPRKRPIAGHLLEHPWLVQHVAAALRHGPSRPGLERLLDPIPIYCVQPPAAGECIPASSSSPSPTSEAGGAPLPSRSPSRVRFDSNAAAAEAGAAPMLVDGGSAAEQSQGDALRALRAEFGGDASAGVPAMRGNLKASYSFTAPARQYENVAVQQLSTEEKGETGAAIGMKARLQLYMERQRTPGA